MVNLGLCTKFEISIYTSYEDMKGGAFRWLGANQGHRQCHHSPFDTAQQRIWFLFNFNGNYASISYRFLDTASYLSKFANFNPHHLRLAPPFGWPRCIFAEIFGVRKLDLAIVWRCFCDQCIATYENTCVWQTETDRQSIYRASIASRGKNDHLNSLHGIVGLYVSRHSKKTKTSICDETVTVNIRRAVQRLSTYPRKSLVYWFSFGQLVTNGNSARTQAYHT